MGGIKTGMVATDIAARKLDKQLHECATKVVNELSVTHSELCFSKKLRKSDIPGGIGACMPDGGVWWYRGKLIAAFEAKKQNNNGNAIERWFKNNFVCRMLNSDMSYITFATGEGANIQNGVIPFILNIAHLDGYNTYVPGRNSCFLSVDGFDDEFIINQMRHILLERVRNAK